jgi:glucose 1-dehydrogenase
MKLEGKVVLVTGGNQGIGQTIALRLAQAGADIIVNYRSQPETADETKAKIEQMGRKAIAVRADLSQIEEIHQLVESSLQQFCQIDVLVNNAGLEKSADFLDITSDDYDRVMDVNLKGVFFTTQAVVNHLKASQRAGKIINISSVHEELPFPHFTAYCASKGGLKMMMRNLAVELAPLGITVNNVAPGAIETPINKSLMEDKDKLNATLKNIPLGRLGQPEDVAGLVAFLASSDADYITGSTFYVDGGLLWNYQEQ